MSEFHGLRNPISPREAREIGSFVALLLPIGVVGAYYITSLVSLFKRNRKYVNDRNI